jgi:hypothetical protein
LSPQKYTQGSTGIFERIRRFFAVDPERSNGVPMKHFRNPAPGGQDPKAYDDPVTVPAADIADNPYWRRDVRRAYPVSSTITQSKAVQLLHMGSAAKPSPQLLAGEEGSKQLVEAGKLGDEGGGLAVYLQAKDLGLGKVNEVLVGEGGMPPMPVATRSKVGTAGVEKYEVAGEQAYNDQYPCRSFI